MKFVNRLVIVSAVILGLSSCTEAGTLESVDKGRNSEIEVFKYFYAKGEYVFVSRFKNQKNVVTTTWSEQVGKNTVTKGNVVIYENDSIQVIKKK